MQKSKPRWKLIAFVSFLVIASLAAGIFISRRTAIQSAMQGCDSFRLKAEESPSTIKARINTYQRVAAEPLWIAWTVDMEGRWLLVDGPPRAAGQSVPARQYFGRCQVVVNAFTGSVKEVEAYPISYK